MNKIWKYFEFAYLIIAGILLVDGITSWETDKEKARLKLIFAGLALIMFFFKRNFRKRIEKR